jgi:hypothetical protein
LLTDPNQARLSGLTEELVARVFRLRQMEAMLGELDATVLRLREAAARKPQVVRGAEGQAPVVAAEAASQKSGAPEAAAVAPAPGDGDEPASTPEAETSEVTATDLPDEALVEATQMAIAGKTREQIEEALQ